MKGRGRGERIWDNPVQEYTELPGCDEYKSYDIIFWMSSRGVNKKALKDFELVLGMVFDTRPVRKWCKESWVKVKLPLQTERSTVGIKVVAYVYNIEWQLESPF